GSAPPAGGADRPCGTPARADPAALDSGPPTPWSCSSGWRWVRAFRRAPREAPETKAAPRRAQARQPLGGAHRATPRLRTPCHSRRAQSVHRIHPRKARPGAPPDPRDRARPRWPSSRIWRGASCTRLRPLGLLLEDPGTFLPRKELALAVHAPSVSGEAAIAAHDTVAGNGHCQVIRPAGLSHRAHGFGLSDALGYVSIAHRGAWRNLPQSLPDAFLECRSLEIQRQLEAALRRFDGADHLGD